MDYKIAICGKKEEILAFKGLGLTPLFVNTSVEAEEKLLQLKKKSGGEEEKYAIIFITEDLFQEFSEEGVEKISSGVLPAIVPLPGHAGTTGFGDKRMRKFVEQAVGSDIFGEN
jgi:V/A-type H+-transporting ATPase subunit F